MKKFIFFARVSFLSTVILLVSPHLNALTTDPPYHVVIGAFSIRGNAVKFAREANSQNMHAQFDLQHERNLFYVYVFTTTDHDQAIAEALRLRKHTRYSDSWVFHGYIGNPPEPVKGTDINPETRAPIEKIVPFEIKEEPSPAEITPIAEPVKDKRLQKTDTTLAADEIKTRNFVFDLYRATDGTMVEGEVDEIDVERARKMATYKGNEPVKVAVPTSKSKEASFVCSVMGYRKLQQDFVFDNTSAKDVQVDEAGNIVMPFELIRLQKGDIAVMYNVFFYKDAAVMRPESRFEVDNLLQMLKENSKYRIRIHGHTNGNAHGKIITIGEPRNYFSLTGSSEGFGSAKKLSYERAAAIKSYLVDNGIEESRMEIKAWGGKRPIHDKNAARAQENVRVEVEILEH